MVGYIVYHSLCLSQFVSTLKDSFIDARTSCNSCHRHLSEVALCFLMKLDRIVRGMMVCYGN